MKSIKSLVGTLLGGIGALAGFGILMTGCGDDGNSGKATQEITKAQLEECCGTDANSTTYEACVKNYQTNGVCSNDIDPGVTTDYGVPDPLTPVVYGPAPFKPDEIEKCCGEDDGSNKYKQCVESYKESGKCENPDEPIYTEYGPSVDPIEECCGKDDGSKKYKQCVESYKESGKCENPDEPIYTEYGPSIDPIEECCGKDDGSEKYKQCVESYKESGKCENPDEPIYTEYGPSIDPIEECCGKDDGSKGYKQCVEDYNKAGGCGGIAVPEYGMPPVDSIEECCGPEDDSDTYKACVEDYNANGQTCTVPAPDIPDPPVYGPAPDPGTDVPEIDTALEDCCGQEPAADASEEDKVNYKKCVKNYQENGNHCGATTVYGMPDPGQGEDS